MLSYAGKDVVYSGILRILHFLPFSVNFLERDRYKVIQFQSVRHLKIDTLYRELVETGYYIANYHL